jgi:MtrB/PioB family decaheme-associated outer membrane protein
MVNDNTLHHCPASLHRHGIALLIALFPLVAQAQNEVDIGIGNTGPSSFRLGEYNGLYESGNFLRGSISAGEQSPYTDRSGKYWSMAVRNLGLDTLGLQFEKGARGTWKWKAGYQGMAHYRFDNPVLTPFRGSGSSLQNLPTNWIAASSTNGFASLQQDLQPVSIQTDREHLQTSIQWRLNPAWTLDSEFQQQRKTGNDTLGAIFGSSGGNPRGAVLAAPIDYVTNNYGLSMSWQQQNRSLVLAYRGSVFNNAGNSLRWQNPFDNSQWPSGAGYSDGAYGQMALAPDNSSDTFSLSGVFAFAGGSRFSGSLSVGRMQQDELFLPYSSVFQAATPLPATSLQGLVRTVNGSLNFSTRLSPRLSLRSRYTLDIRDNDTRRQIFQRIPGDAAAQGELISINARLNRPYSHVKQLFSADTSLRLGGGKQLQIEYELGQKNRDMVDVDEVREQTVGLNLGFPFLSAGKGKVAVTQSRRSGSDYQPNAGFLNGHNPDFISTLNGNDLYENDPLLRRFHLADRNRRQVAVNFNTVLNSTLSFNADSKFTRDDFPDSQIGLQASDTWYLNVMLSWAPGGNLDFHAYQNWQAWNNRQAGYERNNRTPFFPAADRLGTNNWWMQTRDRVESSGIGLNWQSADRRLSVKADASLSDANTKTRPYSTGISYAPLPDFSTRFASLTLNGEYALNSGRKLGLRYRYDDYQSNDFALDNVAVDTLGNVLLLGNASPFYSGAIVELHFSIVLP